MALIFKQMRQLKAVYNIISTNKEIANRKVCVVCYSFSLCITLTLGSLQPPAGIDNFSVLGSDRPLLKGHLQD